MNFELLSLKVEEFLEDSLNKVSRNLGKHFYIFTL